MKIRFLCLSRGCGSCWCQAPGALPPAPTLPPRPISTSCFDPSQEPERLGAGKVTEAAQADNLKQFDDLLTKYKGDTSDDVAKILYTKAVLYVQVFKNDDKAAELFKQGPARLS